MTLEELKAAILGTEPEALAVDMVLTGDAELFAAEKVEHVRTVIAVAFGVDRGEIDIRVVGSAKLGYALFEKRKREGGTLPRFRPFGANSDIDLAIVCPKLFEAIWDELSAYAIRRPYFPWNSSSLGDYLIHGWLRPDHFPNGVRLTRCDRWWEVFRTLSADARLGRRRIRGAPFHTVEHLKRYVIRGLRECRKTLELEA